MVENTIKQIIFRVTARHFCAGGVLVGCNVTKVAPIIRYMNGWTAKKVKQYCDKKGWYVERANGN